MLFTDHARKMQPTQRDDNFPATAVEMRTAGLHAGSPAPERRTGPAHGPQPSRQPRRAVWLKAVVVVAAGAVMAWEVADLVTMVW